MQTTPCECNAPGWCERHHCFKVLELMEQCQTSQLWFERWERGEGPCLPIDQPVVPDQMPGLAQRAINFGTAVIRHVASGLQKVDQATCDTRLARCRQCSSCDTDRMVCRQPGCGCSLNVKAWWASEDCPLHHWASFNEDVIVKHPPATQSG